MTLHALIATTRLGISSCLLSLCLCTALSAQPGAQGGTSPRPLPKDYVIGVDDILTVVFWREKDLSAEVVVRPDGDCPHLLGADRIRFRRALDHAGSAVAPIRAGGRIEAGAASA